MRYQANEKIGPWVNDSIARHGQDENILWEPSLMPGQQGEAILICFFWMPGAAIGSTMQGSFAIHDPLGITDAEIDEVVADFLRQMRDARTEEIVKNTPHPSQSPTEVIRGQQRASGLLIP